MSYATIENVYGRYSPIHTLVGSLANQVDSLDVSSVFISDAENLIDAYISRRYATPVTSGFQILTQIASDLAIFNMLVEKLPETPDFFQPRYDRSIKTLEMIADGKINLPLAIEVQSGDQEAWSSTQTFHPIFSPVLNPVDQAVDKDQIDQAKDDRSGDG
jgi:phage gp36-like protein